MESSTFSKGGIVSADITTERADGLRDFYQSVMGWTVEDMPMSDEDGSYSDYVMKDANGNWVGGVCHRRGPNLGIPPQWITYVNVEDVGSSVRRCVELGGAVVKESKDKEGKWQYAIISDPSGAFIGLTSV